MPRHEMRRPEESTVVKITPPERKPYQVPKPWTKKAIPEGYILEASNGNEVMRFVATANTAEFPEGRTLEQASQHADKILAIMMGPEQAREVA